VDKGNILSQPTFYYLEKMFLDSGILAHVYYLSLWDKDMKIIEKVVVNPLINYKPVRNDFVAIPC